MELVDKFAEDLDNEHLNAHNVAEFVKAYNA